MILLTGYRGFIGSRVAEALLAREEDPIYVGMEKEDDFDVIQRTWGRDLTAVIHLGAISDTTATDRDLISKTNVGLSWRLAFHCMLRKIPFIYASSASVYGNGAGPLNLYAQSKYDFDLKMLNNYTPCPWYGLRFFNVYGPGEDHKGAQASLIHQISKGKRDFFGLNVMRDFVHVSDVVKVILWFLNNKPLPGLYDVGTGVPRYISELLMIAGVDYREVPMPESLKGRYQFHTRADLTKLRAAGYYHPFLSLEEGIRNMANT